MWQERSKQLDNKKEDPREHERIRSNVQTSAYE
jgi:hypothetical protein